MIKFNDKYEPQKNVIITLNKVNKITEPKKETNKLIIINGMVMSHAEAKEFLQGLYA